MYKKKNFIFMSIAAVIFFIFILIVSLISNRSIFAERSTYASAEEMKAALQETFVHFTSYGDKTKWVINGNTATHTYSDGNAYKYNITKWDYKRGMLEICLDTTTHTEKLVITKDGCIMEKKDLLYYPKHSGYYDTDCQYEDCSQKTINESIFCERHSCHRAGCNIEVCRNGFYCLFHTCQGGNYGCYNEVDTAGQKCDACRGISSPSQKNNTTEPYHPKGHSNSHKEMEMPDCDDYEDYDDFMDTWDGNMPDGSDAEDYWENW